MCDSVRLEGEIGMQHNGRAHQASPVPQRDAADTPFRFGFDAPARFHQYGPGEEIIGELGFNFWNAYYHALFADEELTGQTRVARHIDTIGAIGDWCTHVGLDWTADLEQANGVLHCHDEQGVDWFNRPDGRHYHLFPDPILDAFARSGRFLGLRYDEIEWMQIGRHFYKGLDRHAFWNPENDRLDTASEAFTRVIQEIAAHHERHGVRLFTEHVFPVLLHCFARAGYTPAMKVLKENWAPPCLAIAIGAALQYNRPLWITPDLWGVRGYLDHSALEYEGVLKLAYHLGADAIYTECLFPGSPDATDSLIRPEGNGYSITPYGQAARRFIHEYVPANPRAYRFTDITPRVAIIRQPDTCWGQATSWTPDRLFGNDAWPSNAVTEAWLRLWHLLTNGAVHADALTWHADSYGHWHTGDGGREHQSFCPLDGVVVFDHRVGEELLHDVEVIFLTGLGISEPTLAAVANRVNQGAVCVALPHLLPPTLPCANQADFTARDGAGWWVSTNDFLAPHARKAVRSILPEPHRIRYRFGQNEVRMRCGFADPDRIDVEIS